MTGFNSAGEPIVTSEDRAAALAKAGSEQPGRLPEGIVVSLDDLNGRAGIEEEYAGPDEALSTEKTDSNGHYHFFIQGLAEEAEAGRTYKRDEAEKDKTGGTKQPPEQPVPESVVLFDPTTLEGKVIPERRWVVADWIPATAVTALYGDGSAGKTLLAMQLMICCAAGLPWLGLPTLKCKAIGFLCEDDGDELHMRAADIIRHLGLSFADLGDLRWQSRVGMANLLMEFDSGGKATLTALFEDMQRQAVAFGAKLVTIDTAADTYGGNENIRPQVRQFIQGCCGRLARAIDGAVLLCAHPSRAGLAGEGDGGSTAWNNSVRSRLYLAKPRADSEADEPADNGLRVLTRKKANYASSGDAIELRWESGCYVNTRPTGVLASIDQGAADKAFLAALDELTKQNTIVSRGKTSSNYAPKMMMGMAATKGLRLKDLEHAMTRLFEGGKIINTAYGRPSDKRFKIDRV